MRLGLIFQPSSNAAYRAVDPMRAMERRGHEVVWPDESGALDLARFAGCDVLHIYRTAPEDPRSFASLRGSRTPIVYDNDDDFTAVPKESPDYKKFGGAKGRAIFVQTVKMARLAHTFTTTSEVLAEKYRQAGVERMRVIGNYLDPQAARPRRGHEGIVIGWIAGIDHRVDLESLPIAAALERLVARHDDVRVESVGVDLGLPERYRHEGFVPFFELPERIGGYDVGIAPLADLPVNWARSDIKVKEYAASGVPWLASPIGPYRDLGEAQGGRLVPDDGWFEALDRLVTHRRERRRLSRAARKWAKGQTIDAVADRWEEVFAAAAAGQ